jgi:hypothetical protein
VEFKALVRFQILAFDAPITGSAEGAVQQMVVMFTVRRVIEYVELGAWKWFLAGAADEAFLMIASC